MKKILIVGSGAREHVIAETLLRGTSDVSLVVAGTSRNPGLLEKAMQFEVMDITDSGGLKQLAGEAGVDWAILGPEAPIAEGATDALASIGVPTFAPTQSLGRLETSKSFTRDLLAKYKIDGNPDFTVFTTPDGLAEYMNKLEGNYVVKADGLKGGKGVKVSGEHLATIEDGVTYATACIEEAGRVVIEEKFVGEEFSLMFFSDGVTVVPMPAVQDHKRAFEGDTGPNTGGMGSYSDADHSLPFLRANDIEAATVITKQVADALHQETGTHFVGIMYGGFMATKHGVGLVEYNARFGDPEVMNVLSLLETSLVDICEAAMATDLTNLSITFEKAATVCKYVVPEGYPDSPVKNEMITIGAIPDGVKIYYASVDQREDGLYLAGSRALAFVGKGASIQEAEAKAEAAVQAVAGPVFHRSDIGTEDLVKKRVEHMNQLRS